MKKIVLYIDTMNRGGAQRVMLNLAKYLAQEGIKTILVTDFSTDGKNQQYNVPDYIERRYLSDSLSGNRLIKNIARIIELRKIIKAEKPNVILSFLGRPNITMLIATIALRVRKIVSVRNDPHREYGNSRLKQRLIGRLFNRVDGIVFQTKDAAEFFPQSVQRKSAIILNPVDIKFFQIKRETITRNIVTVSRLERQKNHKLLITAFSRIANSIPDENLLIYGDGPLKGELEQYVESLNLKSRVIFMGNIPNIEEELTKASLFVLSSDWEGLPNALMEAMAVGVPVISTDCPCGGPRALIENEDEGILVPCGDVNAIASAMLKLMNDRKIQIKLSKNEKERAKDFYPEKIFRQWFEFLLNEELSQNELYDQKLTKKSRDN